MYSPTDLDIAVAHVGRGYRVNWIDFGDAFWKLPTLPQSFLFSERYILDWEFSIPYNLVVRPEDVQLIDYVRGGDFLEKAFGLLEEYVGEATISTVLMTYDPLLPPVETYIVCIGNVIASNINLDTAKWEAIGAWGIKNVADILNPSYLKTTNNASVFLVDENTFLII